MSTPSAERPVRVKVPVAPPREVPETVADQVSTGTSKRRLLAIGAGVAMVAVAFFISMKVYGYARQATFEIKRQATEPSLPADLVAGDSAQSTLGATESEAINIGTLMIAEPLTEDTEASLIRAENERLRNQLTVLSDQMQSLKQGVYQAPRPRRTRTHRAPTTTIAVQRPAVISAVGVSSSASVEPAVTSTVASSGKVNINTASLDELQSLPRIGPTAASQIIARRERSRIASVDDLAGVTFVGRQTAEAIASKVSF